MAPQRFKIADLDDASLERLRKMEESMDTVILAFEPYHPLANLEDDQLQRLHALEEELGVVLVAFKKG